MNRNLFFMVFLCTATAFVGSPVMAGSINVDFGPNDVFTSGVYSGIGAAPDAGTVWNGVTPGAALVQVGTPYTSSALVDSGGNATGATVTVQPVFWAYDGAADSVIAPALMHDYVFTPSAGGASTFTFSIDGLTSGGTYDLYLYSDTGAQVTDFSVGGIVKTVANTAGQTAFTLGSNYQLYEDVTATSGSISVSVTGSATGPYYGVINGFQVVAVPEPSTIAMLATGLISLMAYSWRKRK
jgi:hypothetical protein